MARLTFAARGYAFPETRSRRKAIGSVSQSITQVSLGTAFPSRTANPRDFLQTREFLSRFYPVAENIRNGLALNAQKIPAMNGRKFVPIPSVAGRLSYGRPS